MSATPLNDQDFEPHVDPKSYSYADPRDMIEQAKGKFTPVQFESSGSPIAGHLYLPSGPGPFPAVVLIGPETFVKEQAPANYAWRLAERGYAALAFDPRGRGESGGEPADLESPSKKVADIRAAVDFLSSRHDVNGERMFAVGICQGSSEMIVAVADDDRVKALATLAGHYRDRQGDEEWFQGADKLDARINKAKAAKSKFEQTGQIDYVKAVDKSDPNAGMPGELVWGWYQPWADADLWPNRFALMSDVELLAFESMSGSQRLKVPYLMFHSSQCMLPDAARRHYERVPATSKKAHWWGDTLHFQFYDDPHIIDPAVECIDEWFQAHGDMQASIPHALQPQTAEAT